MVTPAPSNTEKKPQINGHASPSHLAANHAGKQRKSHCFLCPLILSASPVSVILFCDVFVLLSAMEGYMKTDDRMRLAKERREEKERSLGG